MQKLVTIFFILVLQIFVRDCYATDFNKEKHKFSFDSTYVQSFSNKLNITMPLSTRYMKFSLADKATKNTLEYQPNQNTGIGLSVNYKWIGIGFGISAGFLNNDEAQKGKTKSFDFTTNLYLKRVVIDLNFQNYQGFYINNHSKYTQFWKNQGVYPVREDIKAGSFGSTFHYVLNNKKFSYPGAFAYTYMQKRSTGSLLLGGFFSFFEVSGDSSFVYGDFKNYFSENSYVNYANSFQYGVSVGYIYTFVIRKRWYATVSLNPGTSILKYYAYGEYQNSGEDSLQTIEYYNKSAIAFKLQSRFAFGYNSDHWYGGMVIMGDSFSQNNKSLSQIDYEFGNFRMFVGRRFGITRSKSTSN